ncbi:MAG: prepilin-type N-terminal cleavage/methylation domain-containing protein, partial [Verrucomicrobia bacterium]|nr:prepilin-type N-terminal cleavage/methylation domain-containing protein [Verrucomicrobiota bacterium]
MERDQIILSERMAKPGDAIIFDSGFTIIEVVYASAIAALAVLALYSTIMIGYAMICANQQRLDADALAFDRTLEIFNTYNFTNAVLATNLPPASPPAGASLLPSNSEIRVMITPNLGTPYKWDVEVRVKRN